MKRLLSVIIALFLAGLCSAQYLGGGDDGFSQRSSEQMPLNDQNIYCSGSLDDGYSQLFSGVITFSDQSIYANGGVGDGFGGLNYSGPVVFSPAWAGGNQDGFHLTDLESGTISPAFYCYGGTGDGFFSIYPGASYFGPGIWLGAVSNSWENPANWSGNLAPDVAVDVLIPAGKMHYPLIPSAGLSVNNSTGWYTCKSLTIKEGGSLINHSDLFLYGNMFVAGIYLADDPVYNHIYLHQGGNLLIQAPGQVQIGQ